MNALSLGLSASALLFWASVAAASLLVAGAAIAVLRLRRLAPLPLRHAVLVSALGATMASPVVLALLAAGGVAMVRLPTDDVRPLLPVDALTAMEQLQPAITLTTAVPGTNEPTTEEPASESRVPSTRSTPPVIDQVASPVPLTASPREWAWSDVGQGVVLAWMVGWVASLLHLASGFWRLRSLVARCQPVAERQVLAAAEQVGREMGLRRTPAILESNALAAPLTMGLVRPRVVVPTTVIGELQIDQLHGLLRHEFGHIVRRDPWIGLLQRASLAAYWWNPLVHWVSGAISEVREQICDDLATRDVEASDSYAELLVELARRAVRGRPLPATIGMFDGSRREFSRRIERLLDDGRSTTTVLDRRMKWTTAVVAVVLVGLSASASIQFATSAAEPETTVKAADTQALMEPSEPPAVNWPKELWGVIHDEEGRPIAGAKVRLDLEKIHEYAIGRRDETKWSGEFDTGSDGKYRFDTADFPEMKHRPFCLMMNVTADGYSDVKYWNWYSRRDAKVDEHWADVKLWPGRVVRGRVLDHNDQPVPGAIVKAAGYYGLNSFGRSFAWNPRQTDEDGRFTIAVPSKEEGPIELWIVSRDWAPQRVPMPKQGDELSDIRLQPGGRVSGTVADENGSPVVGAVVVAESVDGGTLPHTGFAVHLATKTDAQGHYQLPPIDGIYKVYLSQAQETDDRLDHRFVVADVPPPLVTPVRVAVSTHKDEQVDFRAGPTLHVRGTVRWADGKPVADCQVQASYLPPGFDFGIWLDDTRTDVGGRYTLELPKPIEGISVHVSGAFDADRVWHYASPAEGVNAKRSGLQFLDPGPLTGDVDGMDWVLKTEDETDEIRSSVPAPKGAAVDALEKLQRRYDLRQRELQDALAQTNDFEKRNELQRTRDPRVLLADDYLALEEQDRGTDVGLAALVKLSQRTAHGYEQWPKLLEARREMYKRLGKHYLQHPDLDLAFKDLTARTHSAEELEVIARAIEESPHASVQAAALYLLASYHADQADSVATKLQQERVDPAASRAKALELSQRLEAEFADVREPERIFNESGLFWRRPDTGESAGKPNYGALGKGLIFDLEELQIGLPAPDITFEKEGKLEYGTQYLGKVTVIVFEQSFFGDARVQRLAEWAQPLSGKPLDVLVVRGKYPGGSGEFDESALAPLRFITEDHNGPIATQWSIRRRPTIFVVDGNGIIRASRLSEVPFHLVTQLLNGAEAETDRVFVPRAETVR